MKFRYLALALLSAALGACTQTQPVLNPQMAESYRRQRAFDLWTVDAVQQAAETNALLEQHAVYPYYFTDNSATLTELARHDLTTLATAYKESAGTLILIRGDAPDALYARRREAVLAALTQAGVAADRVTIVDGFPGGEGITGESIVEARRNAKKSYAGSNTDTGSLNSGGKTPVKPEGMP